MKMKNFFRMQAIAIGFGAALLFAASATPAQDIDNTTWDDSQNVGPMTLPAPAATTSAAHTNAGEPVSMTPAAMITTQAVSQEASATAVPADTWVMAVSLFCIALVALYALSEARKASRSVARIGQNQRGSALS